MHRKNVQRVIYTSSTGTIRRTAVTELPGPVTRVYSEEDWNEECLELVQKLGKDTHPVDKYHASKVLSERGRKSQFHPFHTSLMPPVQLLGSLWTTIKVKLRGTSVLFIQASYVCFALHDYSKLISPCTDNGCKNNLLPLLWIPLIPPIAVSTRLERSLIFRL